MDSKKYILPEHKCSLTISHNQHRDYYQPIEEYIEESGDEFETEEAKRRSIETDEIWVIQWYPNTPIGSYTVIAPTLEEALRLANED